MHVADASTRFNNVRLHVATHLHQSVSAGYLRVYTWDSWSTVGVEIVLAQQRSASAATAKSKIRKRFLVRVFQQG